jgi:hypothetical protein
LVVEEYYKHDAVLSKKKEIQNAHDLAEKFFTKTEAGVTVVLLFYSK